jgi:signal transduction histidine kinase
MMGSTPTVERLASLPALADIPREQLEWLVEHGQVHHFEDGATIRANDTDRIGLGLFVVISGRFSVRVHQNGVEREVREVTAGRITGYLPYSRITTPRGFLVADGPVELLAIRREDIKELARECYEFTAACVHEMLDRVRVFKADDKHQEKMAALGRLSAGLAHELNNPTSAVARAAGELETTGTELVAASRALGAAGLEGESMMALESLAVAVRRTRKEPPSPLERADLEDRILEWLEDHGVDPELAYPLAEHGLAVEDLATAATKLSADRLAVVLRFVAVEAAVRGLTADIAAAAERIHSLVAAVKKHTHMDRGSALEPIVIGDHLRDAVTLMGSKASEKGVALELRTLDDLPAVEGSVADLNQVWMHLIDNAIDAATGSVGITVDVNQGHDIVVRVVDDGPGIPDPDRERVFEPFFTTKDVGEGRGLGLDVVRTVVRGHKGTVDLTSRPGRTEFRVTLPAGGGTS